MNLRAVKSSNAVPWMLRSAVLAILALTFALPAIAQDDEFEFNPSPKIVLTKEEKDVLAAEKDEKKYLKLALSFMETRLKSAESQVDSGEYDLMLQNAGGFHALMDTTYEFLKANDPRRGRVIDTFKRFEIELRGFTPRIEKIRREAPDKYSAYLIKLLRRVREVRAKSVDRFFGESVVGS